MQKKKFDLEADNNIKNLEKKPVSGGKPIKENKAIVRPIACQG